MSIGLDSIMLLLHVLFFVYWLGGDVGVFYSARYVMRGDIGVEARAYCAKIMTFLDQIPRVSMVGITVVGATLGVQRGYFGFDPLWLIPVWIVGIIWVWAILFLFVNEHHPEKIRTVKKVDFNFRVVMVVFLLILGVSSLMGNGITDDKWLAAKILVLDAIMVCGVLLRLSMKDFGQYFGPMMKGTATPEQIATAQAMMGRAKKVVLAIWFFLVVAAAFGMWKPI
jgi:hypothetical protein